jgi:hypothetical protein
MKNCERWRAVMVQWCLRQQGGTVAEDSVVTGQVWVVRHGLSSLRASCCGLACHVPSHCGLCPRLLQPSWRGRCSFSDMSLESEPLPQQESGVLFFLEVPDSWKAILMGAGVLRIPLSHSSPWTVWMCSLHCQVLDWSLAQLDTDTSAVLTQGRCSMVEWTGEENRNSLLPLHVPDSWWCNNWRC